MGDRSVDTTLNYLDAMDEKPRVYQYTPPAGTAQRTTRVTRREVRVHDARVRVRELSLDREGVELTRQESSVSNFYDRDEVRSVYYPEVERLVKQVTGATRVLVFDHNVRCATKAARGEDGAQMPVKFAHNDYTERSGPQRVRDLVDADEVEALLADRFAVINVWRPITGPVRANPLAVCDAASIGAGELVETDLVYRDRTGEVYSLAFSPDHRWLYFPEMEQREVMLIKCYDSAGDGRARFTCHSAFDDPTTPHDAPARESIEVRTLAFFPRP